MSTELKSLLNQALETNYQRSKKDVEEKLERYRSLLLKVAEAKEFDVVVWFEGTNQSEISPDESDLQMLEQAQLVKGQMKYTHRNVYRRYTLTAKGAEMVENLSKEHNA